MWHSSLQYLHNVVTYHIAMFSTAKRKYRKQSDSCGCLFVYFFYGSIQALCRNRRSVSFVSFRSFASRHSQHFFQSLSIPTIHHRLGLIIVVSVAMATFLFCDSFCNVFNFFFFLYIDKHDQHKFTRLLCPLSQAYPAIPDSSIVTEGRLGFGLFLSPNICRKGRPFRTESLFTGQILSRLKFYIRIWRVSLSFVMQ